MGKTSQSSEALVEALTRRETDILVHLVKNRSNQEIARLESLALSSVKWYVNQILGKMGAANRTEAAARALELGLIPPETQAKLPPLPPRCNLPRQLSSFIGRETEIAHLTGLVLACPLVTLTGSGGVGKTRLALETANRLLPHFPNGVWLVELAPLTNPDLIPQAIVNSLSLMGHSRLSPTRRLCEYLRGRCFLLLLDNCEHVLDSVKDLAHELLHACPHLSILATSRELLGVEGETVYRCPSLSLPGETLNELLSSYSESEALRLFSARAASVSYTFTLDESNAPVVARICRRLDGIPLAIELAAARSRLLSLEQIAARLEDVFGLLTGGSHTALPRHQTLTALIDWSYNLLSHPEQLLLQRLSVFAGSCSLEMAEAVCGFGSLLHKDILNLLGLLVDKSLVEVVPGPAGMRYRMLETIRQYTCQKLEQAGEQASLQDRHLDTFLAFSIQFEPNLIGPRLREWRELVDMELDNLHSALTWSLTGPIEKGLRIAAALQWYWHGRINIVNDEVSWLERLLAVEADGPEELRFTPARRLARGKAINTAAHLRVKDGPTLAQEAVEIFAGMGAAYRLDWAIALLWTGERQLQEMLAIFREIGDRFWITNVLWELSVMEFVEGNLLQARGYLEESLALLREIGYKEGEGSVLLALGRYEFLLGEPARAMETLRICGECFIAAGSMGKEHFPSRIFGFLYLAQGDYQQAETHWKMCLEESRNYGVVELSIGYLGRLAWTALTAGDRDRANQYLNEALRLSTEFIPASFPESQYVLARLAILDGNYAQAYIYLQKVDTVYLTVPGMLQAYAVLDAAQGQMHRAAILCGTLEAYPWWVNLVPPSEHLAFQQALAAVRAMLSPEEFVTAWEEGRAMTARQALDFVIAQAPYASSL